MRRPVKALIIVVAIVLAVPAADLWLRSVGIGQEAGFTPLSLDAASLIVGNDPDEALAKIEELVQRTGDVPEWFESEIGILPGARDVRASGPVVGYVVEVGCEKALEDVEALMEMRGWTCVPMGDVNGATFLKESGPCTWAFVTCTQAGSATSVVTRYLRT